MYYLQTRYYNPENERFLNADIYVSTGRGLLDSNMFAYCWNNPVIRSDEAGTDPFTQATADDTNPLNDYGIFGRLPGGGGNTWRALTRTLQSAKKGLNMAMGQRDMSHFEKHHVLSIYRKEQFAQYTDPYDLVLDSAENIVYLPGHRGRHTNYYHNLMLECIEIVTQVANGNKDLFYEGFSIIYNYVKENPWLPYAK